MKHEAVIWYIRGATVDVHSIQWVLLALIIVRGKLHQLYCIYSTAMKNCPPHLCITMMKDGDKI